MFSKMEQIVKVELRMRREARGFRVVAAPTVRADVEGPLEVAVCPHACLPDHLPELLG
jgi:hypothetical protein